MPTNSEQCVLTALLVVLVLGFMHKNDMFTTTTGDTPPPATNGFTQGEPKRRLVGSRQRGQKARALAGPLRQPGQPVREKADPYTLANDFIEAARGMTAADLTRGTEDPWTVPGALERYHQSGITITPEQRSVAEQNLWTDSIAESSAQAYNTEDAFSPSKDATAYHETVPALDYNSHITDTVLDSRSVENHAKWVDMMIPWAGTATTVDTMDEAVEASTNFIGLRRPQPVAQHNALQITERDMYTFLGNAKFNFLG